MASPVRVYTPAEAAAVSQIGVKAVHNAIDKRVIAARPKKGGASLPRRTLTIEDILHLKLWYGVGAVLTADRRQQLFEAIRSRPAARTVRAGDLLIVDVAEARRQVADRVRELKDAETHIHRVKGIMGGDPVFKGTRIPVRMITSMLMQGAEETEILEGYPKLTPRSIKLAKIWVAAHPSRGRPKNLGEQGLKIKSTKRIPLKGARRLSPNRKAGAVS